MLLGILFQPRNALCDSNCETRLSRVSVLSATSRSARREVNSMECFNNFCPQATLVESWKFMMIFDFCHSKKERIKFNQRTSHFSRHSTWAMATQHVSVTPQTKMMQATESYPQHATQPPQGPQVGALALGGVVVTRPPLTPKRRGL